MIPVFSMTGNLPPGIHYTDWDEFEERFGNNYHRQLLLLGMKEALLNLKNAGCSICYMNGSFVTIKPFPNDFDGCWDPLGVDLNKLDPVLLNFSFSRLYQKVKYKGELFLSSIIADSKGNTYINFFQIDKNTGMKKGIVAINLESLS